MFHVEHFFGRIKHEIHGIHGIKNSTNEFCAIFTELQLSSAEGSEANRSSIPPGLSNERAESHNSAENRIARVAITSNLRSITASGKRPAKISTSMPVLRRTSF